MRPILLLIAIAVALGCTPAPAPLVSVSPSPSRSPVTERVPAGAFLFFEDFEQGTARWQVPASEGPTWRLLKSYACGGAFTMHLGLPEQTPYTPTAGEAILALQAPLDLKKGRSPRLKFDVLGTAEPDTAITLWAEARDPGAAWKPLGDPVTANHALMKSLVRDLTPWAGRPVELRFRAVTSAGSAPTKGVYLDDVQVIEPS